MSRRRREPAVEQLRRDERWLIQPSSTGQVRLALVSPTPYNCAMSGLSLQAVYALLARTGRVAVERVFLPSETQRPTAGEPLSLETGTPLAQFDVIAFTVAYELDYLAVLWLLDQAGLPLRREDRGDGCPLIVAGGVAVTANPAPLADFVDAFLIGEAELISEDLAVAFSQTTRQARLDALAALAGVYVPSEQRTGPVERLVTPHLDDWATHSVILTPHTEFSDCFLLEVGRGCGRMCLFCLAAHVYRPLRQRSIESLLETAQQALPHTDRIGLLGAALSDYADIGPLATRLAAAGARLSTSSLRVESVTAELARALAHGGQRQITLAPEAATARLRGLIRKPTTDDDLRRAIDTGLAAGLTDFKLYFMVGLPTETEDDVAAVPVLIRGLKGDFPKARFSVSIAPFVPKPHTTLQWAPMAPLAVLEERTRRLRRELAGHARVEAESPRWSLVQAVLARGGPELGAVLATTHRHGSTAGAFRRALRGAGLDEGPYLAPDQDPVKPLPWDVVARPESREALWGQWQRAAAT